MKREFDGVQKIWDPGNPQIPSGGYKGGEYISDFEVREAAQVFGFHP
jgi:hypothetical protein